MPLKRRQVDQISAFNSPVSYRADELRPNRLRDSRNAFANQNRLETRYGNSRYNSTAIVAASSILSCSFFKNSAGTRYILAKIAGSIYTVPTTGASSAIKTGLVTTTKYRGLTMRDVHVLACDADGMFGYNGTNFYALGSAVPAAPTQAVSGVAGTIPAGQYQVRLTFYSSTTGFESNGGTETGYLTVGATNQIDLTDIVATATNPTIDTIYIYLRDVTNNGVYLYSQSISLGTTTATITAFPTSTQTPPLTHGQPTAGGAKYITEFNGKLAATGNGTFPSDVFMSEQYLPDAWNQTATRNILYTLGDGPNTGIATGFYAGDSGGKLDPFLVVFKKRAISIYSEIDGLPKFTQISSKIGCVSNESIVVKNGNVFFLSENGWREISQGRLVEDKSRNAITLGLGDIDDIFSSPGYIYRVNDTQLQNCFSVYYDKLDQYFTWVPEGSNTSFTKIYVYEFKMGGFKVYEFPLSGSCACNAEDSTGAEIVLWGDANGYLYKHSIKETQRSDVNASNTAVSIPAFAHLFWMDGKDFDATYNFRELICRAITGTTAVNIKGWTNFSFGNLTTDSMTFTNTSGFILDDLQGGVLDQNTFSDERDLAKARIDINRVGWNLLLGFFQDTIGANLNLINAQVNFSKNGNCNE